jgi:hypothetical protein
MRRFGRQPYWLLQGWAWHVEQTVKARHLCFPYRSGFVGVGEHGGWDKGLAPDWSVDKSAQLAMKDIASMRRGVWDDRAARHAWGTLVFLDPLPSRGLARDPRRLAHDLGQGLAARARRRTLGAHRRLRVPLEQQLKIMTTRAGESFLADVQGLFVLGSSFKPH